MVMKISFFFFYDGNEIQTFIDFDLSRKQIKAFCLLI